MSCPKRVMAVSVLRETASSRVCRCLCPFFFVLVWTFSKFKAAQSSSLLFFFFFFAFIAHLWSFVLHSPVSFLIFTLTLLSASMTHVYFIRDPLLFIPSAVMISLTFLMMHLTFDINPVPQFFQRRPFSLEFTWYLQLHCHTAKTTNL